MAGGGECTLTLYLCALPSASPSREIASRRGIGGRPEADLFPRRKARRRYTEVNRLIEPLEAVCCRW